MHFPKPKYSKSKAIMSFWKRRRPKLSNVVPLKKKLNHSTFGGLHWMLITHSWRGFGFTVFIPPSAGRDPNSICRWRRNFPWEVSLVDFGYVWAGQTTIFQIADAITSLNSWLIVLAPGMCTAAWVQRHFFCFRRHMTLSSAFIIHRSWSKLVPIITWPCQSQSHYQNWCGLMSRDIVIAFTWAAIWEYTFLRIWTHILHILNCNRASQGRSS